MESLLTGSVTARPGAGPLRGAGRAAPLPSPALAPQIVAGAGQGKEGRAGGREPSQPTLHVALRPQLLVCNEGPVTPSQCSCSGIPPQPHCGLKGVGFTQEGVGFTWEGLGFTFPRPRGVGPPPGPVLPAVLPPLSP